jgi:CRP/FNR family cyclic AMP-dependent transcriptional regulator
MTRNSKRAFSPKAFLAKMNGGRTITDYRKDHVVYRQGNLASDVFYIQKGKVKKSVLSEMGKEAVVGLFANGEFFGEGCLAGESRRLATITTLSQAVIVRMTKQSVLRVIRDEPAFAAMFIDHILKRTGRIEEDLIDQLFNSSEKRLARTLLLLANFGKEGDPEPVLAKISQETLAHMVGTTRARVNQFMNKFRKLGLISYNGKIEVHRALLDAVLHDQPHIKS